MAELAQKGTWQAGLVWSEVPRLFQGCFYPGSCGFSLRSSVLGLQSRFT